MSNKIKEAKQVLKEAGYFTDNLWHIDDVLMNFNVDEDTAQQILSRALQNSHITEQVFYTINYIAQDEFNLTKTEDEQ
jgi:hypothetical protein